MIKYRRKENCEIDIDQTTGEAVIWNPDTEVAHILNRSAYCLFELCDGKTSEDITQEYSDLFPKDSVNAVTVQTDAHKMMEHFLTAGIVVEYEE